MLFPQAQQQIYEDDIKIVSQSAVIKHISDDDKEISFHEAMVLP